MFVRCGEDVFCKEVLAAEEIGRREAVGQTICYAKDGMVRVNGELEVEVKGNYCEKMVNSGYTELSCCALLSFLYAYASSLRTLVFFTHPPSQYVFMRPSAPVL